jgi:hypothetical protein
MNGKNMENDTQIPTDKEILDWLEINTSRRIYYHYCRKKWKIFFGGEGTLNEFSTFRDACIAAMLQEKLKQLKKE